MKGVHTYLPAKSEKVHDVIESGGVLHVSSVDVHGVPELVTPRVLVHPQSVHVHVGQVNEAAHHAVEI